MTHHQREIPDYQPDPRLEASGSALIRICAKLPQCLAETPAGPEGQPWAKLNKIYASIVQVLADQPAALDALYSRADKPHAGALIDVLLGAISNCSDQADLDNFIYYLSLMFWFHLTNPYSWQFVYSYFFADKPKFDKSIAPAWKVIVEKDPGIKDLDSLNPFFHIVQHAHLNNQNPYMDSELHKETQARCKEFLSLCINSCHAANGLLDQWTAFSNPSAKDSDSSEVANKNDASLNENDRNSNAYRLVSETLDLAHTGYARFQFQSLIIMDEILGLWQNHAGSSFGSAIKRIASEIGEALFPLASIDKNDKVTIFLGKTSKTFRQIQQFFGTDAQTSVSHLRRQSFRHLLNLIDQHDSFEIWDQPRIIDFTIMSLMNLNTHFKDKCRRSEVYADYNQLNTKISMPAMLLVVNFMLGTNLSNMLHEDNDLPEVLTSSFKHFSLPPLSKPDYFFPEHTEGSGDSSEDQLTMLCHDSRILERLIHCTSLNLNLLSMCIRDEMQALSAIDTYSAAEVGKKLFYNFVNLAFSSLCTSLQLLTTVHESNGSVATTMARRQVYQIISDILQVSEDSSLTWLSLINFAHDVCFEDIRWYSIFESLFDYLVAAAAEENPLQDGIVLSGLETFVSTFGNGTCVSRSLSKCFSAMNQEPVQYHTLSTADLQHLYTTELLGAKKAKYNEKFTPSDSDAPRSNPPTPKKVTYTVNSARQQSVHVDEFDAHTS